VIDYFFPETVTITVLTPEQKSKLKTLPSLPIKLSNFYSDYTQAVADTGELHWFLWFSVFEPSVLKLAMS